MNNNAYKTTLMFLGIIFFALLVRMFHADPSLFVQEDATTVACVSDLCDK